VRSSLPQLTTTACKNVVNDTNRVRSRDDESTKAISEQGQCKAAQAKAQERCAGKRQCVMLALVIGILQCVGIGDVGAKQQNR
jgi:hypothetical protein